MENTELRKSMEDEAARLYKKLSSGTIKEGTAEYSSVMNGLNVIHSKLAEDDKIENELSFDKLKLTSEDDRKFEEINKNIEFQNKKLEADIKLQKELKKMDVDAQNKRQDKDIDIQTKKLEMDANIQLKKLEAEIALQKELKQMELDAQKKFNDEKIAADISQREKELKYTKSKDLRDFLANLGITIGGGALWYKTVKDGFDYERTGVFHSKTFSKVWNTKLKDIKFNNYFHR